MDDTPRDAGATSEPPDTPWPVVGIVRAVRRHADLSQRELARWARVHHATIGRIEAGRTVPSIELLRRIVGAVGCRLAVVDEFGRVLRPMRTGKTLATAPGAATRRTWTPSSTPSRGSGGRTSTGWPDRPRRSIAIERSGTRCVGAANGRCG
ncbi:helix-turn-helix transcriptional regulator [Micromonospora vinacea]|uniref:helix-turn-helix transcriptional regulator n=1 Tax=Micromonospora vinacea TaxID=709878 RepID=UPI00345600B8